MRNKHYAVITGASSGIGRAISIKLAERGFNIIAVARRDSLLNELKIELRKINQYIEVVTKSCDLSITDDAISLYEELKAFDIRVWVNNAGVGYYGGSILSVNKRCTNFIKFEYQYTRSSIVNVRA
ncbi:3-oxoacyl-[acyl-carrier-protein] reductase FabG [Providencia rettgeri]|uniref:3-oxoacyl-[acyl-carrier-protein] reductase FabG n=1 Tax=Providencia rettgeri TaxID=587 RepID=A0A379FTJ0_PRORE|nr:3-oxoacyl-[acyl-carrier-protein] reductase FabG [Providencia rettgeri]